MKMMQLRSFVHKEAKNNVKLNLIGNQGHGHATHHGISSNANLSSDMVNAIPPNVPEIHQF